MGTTREEIIVHEFNERWQYRYDKEQYGHADAWHIIHELTDGKYVGDCEDYALTLLWQFEDKSWLKFWWAIFTGKGKICAVGPNKWKTTHAVLRYKGEYVDNWTRSLGPKSRIEDNGFVFSAIRNCWPTTVVILMLKSWIWRKIK